MNATLLNMPSPQISTPYSECASGPGTPMSGISTVAIKDGHEGRPSGEGISAADRINRLGGYFDQARNASYSTSSAPSPASNATTGSTVTTEEAVRATKEAKMIDGMTYDEGVVDTTDRAPVTVMRRRQGAKEVQQQQQQQQQGEEVQEKL